MVICLINSVKCSDARISNFQSICKLGAAAGKTFQILETWKVSKTCTAVSSVSTWIL